MKPDNLKPFLNLTERGRGRRLAALALNALKHYDLEVARLRLVSNSCNGIFRVDARSGEKWILRVTLPEGGHTRDHVAAEMDWLAALARDTDLSVPCPLAARNGALVVEAAAEGVPEPRLCEVFSWVPGTDLARQITPAKVVLLGELSARLHAHGFQKLPPYIVFAMENALARYFLEVVRISKGHRDYFQGRQAAFFAGCIDFPCRILSFLAHNYGICRQAVRHVPFTLNLHNRCARKQRVVRQIPLKVGKALLI